MKKIYSIIFTLVSLNSFAQTLVQSDLPFAGLAWTSGVDTAYADPLTAGGAGQSWDYSTLQTTRVDTSGFMDAAGTPYTSTFPGATLASHQFNPNRWTYFTSASTGYYVNGFVTDTASYVIDPRQMYVPVPFSYGDSHTDVSRVVVNTVFMGFDAEVFLNFHADFQADGYGSLITPTATYPSTLRVKETMLETDSLLLDYLGTGNYTFVGSQQSQKTYFRWFQHGAAANYILGIDGDSLGNFATKSDYVLQWVVLSDNDMGSASSIKTFPNPVNDKLIVNGKLLDGNGTILISNSLGEVVYSTEHNFSSGENLFEIPTGKLADGIYFYSIFSAEKQFHGKFNVLH